MNPFALSMREVVTVSRLPRRRRTGRSSGRFESRLASKIWIRTKEFVKRKKLYPTLLCSGLQLCGSNSEVHAYFGYVGNDNSPTPYKWMRRPLLRIIDKTYLIGEKLLGPFVWSIQKLVFKSPNTCHGVVKCIRCKNQSEKLLELPKKKSFLDPIME